ncbi:MAG TPA: MlaD family protein [Candidatus Acidoferrum sp.]|jgi:phospholipid/cholesterol/gamma-HCH transport system substrate-binding protein|nr:MlaD family protein [Candidatus Acidoferrum sp.]
MSKSRLEWKVGLFVFIGLALLAALLLEFSKGLTFFRPTYEIDLSASNVAGLKTRAAVLMSGVQVGTVSDIRLTPDGKTVTIVLRIFGQYQIHKDARFNIEQSGFLGDQYVAIVPTKNEKELFVDGDKAEAQAPFNLQDFTRSASGFIVRIDDTVKKLNEALVNVSQVVLNPQSLTNMAVTVANLREVSERARNTIDKIDAVVATNGPSLAVSSSNLMAFSQEMSRFATGLTALVATNSPEVHEVVKNLESSSESLKSLLSDVQAGKGLAGDLLKNEQIAANVSQIASNLSITTSNLNRLGLWGILWSHKPPKPEEPPAAKGLPSPKNAYE